MAPRINKSAIHAASLLIAMVSSGFSGTSLAEPPLTTDDASTLDPGACQVETERRRFNRRTELDIVPACNFFGDTELSIGKLRVVAEGAPRIDSVMYSIKKVLIAGGEAGWSAGFNAAIIRAAGKASGTRQNLLTAIFTRPLDANGDTMMHVNVGWVNDREAASGTRRNRGAWGAAVESNVSARWTVVAEAFGQQGQPQAAQLGLRWWAVPKYLQLTTSVGAQRGLGREGRWMSLGVHLETAGSLYY